MTDLATYLPTLALTLFDDEGRILVGIRSPKTNLNHPSVVSVPTMRLPRALAQDLIFGLPTCARVVSILAPGIAHDALGYALWSLLASKLSLAEPIEAKQFDLSVANSSVAEGESLIGVIGDSDITERLTMINIGCKLLEGAHHVPDSNSTFQALRWVRYEAFCEVATTKRLGVLGPEFESIEVCIHGLCVRTAISLGLP